MVDVWWGIVERDGPQCYDFRGYRRLFEKIRAAGLEVQAVMSFHAAGTNVGDTCTISLPRWVLDVGKENPDIFYTDLGGTRNCECLSTGCLTEPVLLGRTPLQVRRPRRPRRRLFVLPALVWSATPPPRPASTTQS
jgi:beta-amylase